MSSYEHFRGQFRERLGLILLFICIASIGNNFISENGIVAVLGDENQFVKRGLWKINRPLSFEKGHVDQIRGNDTEPVMGIWLPRSWGGGLHNPYSKVSRASAACQYYAFQRSWQTRDYAQ
jgi:hypothetical protein